MTSRKNNANTSSSGSAANTSSSVDELLLAALERGGDSLETGRYLVTLKEGAAEEGIQSLGVNGLGMRVADARDFQDQAFSLEEVGDADAVVLPEIGVALVGSEAAEERSMSTFAEIASDSPIYSIDPEYFVFPSDFNEFMFQGNFAQETEDVPKSSLRSLARILEAIANEFQDTPQPELKSEESAMVLGATWGLNACRVPPSRRSGVGIKIAILDTGMDIIGTGHPDFAGRPIVSNTFVGQPVQDLHGHGTHCTGTACGPLAPAGTTPRYGVAYRSSIHIGKVLTNSGGSVGFSVLSGINWAIAQRCEIISMSLGGPGGPLPAYTAAGQTALNNGLLIIAAAGNSATQTGQPANSPTMMSVASLDQNLKPSSFSNFGKIDIAAPGRDVFSSVPRPTRYGIKSGTSMATPHVAGVAALWAETSPNLRGLALWNKLRQTAKPLPFPASRVGAGLVQAP